MIDIGDTVGAFHGCGGLQAFDCFFRSAEAIHEHGLNLLDEVVSGDITGAGRGDDVLCFGTPLGGDLFIHDPVLLAVFLQFRVNE